jgi:uncharacterized protein YecE (DUF72 family)
VPLPLTRYSTSGYSYEEWKGTFYPKQLPVQQMPPFLRRTYSHGRDQQRVLWHAQSFGAGTMGGRRSRRIQFVLKAPKQITHLPGLKDANDLVSTLLEAAGVLPEHSGPLLFQLPPTSKKDIPLLRAFLALLPLQCHAAFEFSDPSWFDDEVFGLLRDHGASLCVADAEGKLEVPFVATTDWGYLRLQRPDEGDAELKAWIKRVQKQDWQDAFVFLKREDPLRAITPHGRLRRPLRRQLS